jgi:hypothetical protein
MFVTSAIPARIDGAKRSIGGLAPGMGFLQRKLAVGRADDPLELQADQAAESVMRQPNGPGSISGSGQKLDRKCADCETEEKRTLQAKAGGPTNSGEAPAIVHDVLRSPGRPLDHGARSFMEGRFGRTFRDINVHTDPQAAASAQSVNARAYTVGRHIVFSSGSYAPESRDGRSLLAHELAHVVQQSGGAGSAAVDRLQRAEKLGTKVTEPTGTKSPYKLAQATFDGANFVLTADGTAIVNASAQSGHPNQVDAADVTACKGTAGESYLNNPRYVGIKDKGPIPEGKYTFRHSDMVTFGAVEQAKMALAKPGQYVDPSGLDLHGDWGAGRVALTPVPGTMVAAKFCGSTSARSGFYLHGGVMTGSSGCIDIGNSAISDVVTKLMGYTTPVQVTVKYTQPPPSVGALGRAAGKFMYPKEKDPSLLDRLKGVFSD